MGSFSLLFCVDLLVMAERLENADERMNFEIEKQIEVEENELFDDNGKPVVHLMHFNVRSSATLH